MASVGTKVCVFLVAVGSLVIFGGEREFEVLVCFYIQHFVVTEGFKVRQPCLLTQQ